MKKSALLALLALSCLPAWAQSQPEFKRTEDIIYGRKFGTALTLDVFQPAKPEWVRGSVHGQRRVLFQPRQHQCQDLPAVP